MSPECVGIIIGLCSGAAIAVAVSCIWGVLLIPARIQDRFQAASPRLLTWAIALGAVLTAMGNGADFTLGLPVWCAGVAFLGGGMFVGMLASALEEILEVAPVLMRRFRLGDVSTGVRWVMMLGKGIGAVLACLAFTF